VNSRSAQAVNGYRHQLLCLCSYGSLRLLQSVVVASAVLVSAFHLLQWNVEIVKRWSNEIQEAVQSKSGMVQVRIVLHCTACFA